MSKLIGPGRTSVPRPHKTLNPVYGESVIAQRINQSGNFARTTRRISIVALVLAVLTLILVVVLTVLTYHAPIPRGHADVIFRGHANMTQLPTR